jgi:hypothetical protein
METEVPRKKSPSYFAIISLQIEAGTLAFPPRQLATVVSRQKKTIRRNFDFTIFGSKVTADIM